MSRRWNKPAGYADSFSSISRIAELISIALLAAVVVAASGPAFAAQSTAHPEAHTRQEIEIQRMIKDLGDDDYTVRETATAALVDTGENALPHLGKAAESPDAEVAWRAQAAIGMIKWQVSPAMWPRIGGLMQYFEQADADTREQIVRIVRMTADENAIPALRRMLRLDENPSVRQTAAIMLADLGSEGLAALVQEGVETTGLDPYDAGVHIIIGNSFLNDGKYDEAAKHYRKALELEPDEFIALYNMACVRSLEMKIDEAIEWLEKSIEAGYDDFEWMEADTDLDNIREDERYQELLRRGPRPKQPPEHQPEMVH